MIKNRKNIRFPQGGKNWNGVYGEMFIRGTQHFVGYEQLESLFNKQVTAKIGEYEYTSTISQ